jgi:hypothetical protein
MIDIENYKRAIQWLERGIAEQTNKPNDETVQDSVMLSFEVTYNLSESILRQALNELMEGQSLAYLSSRELMHYASDEGLALSSAENWLRYGIALEETNRTQGEEFLAHLAPLVPQYVKDLEAFSHRLERRLVSGA